MAKRQSSNRAVAPANPSAAPQGSDLAVVTIRAGEGDQEKFIRDVTHPERFERLAQEWGYILRARSRWAADPDLRDTVAERALDDLESVGIPRDFVQQLASADRIEVELHDWKPDDADARLHEAAAEVPWEYLISAGTRAEGRFQSLLISRLLRNETPVVTPSPPKDVLFVESAPGRLRDKYEFDDEEERIRAAVDATGKREKRMEILNTPQISELSAEVRRKNWEAIHVTGIDTHQMAWLIPNFYEDFRKDKSGVKAAIWKEITKSSDRLRDGMILREGRESERPVLYDKLAEVLVGPTRPRIVTLNLYYSGARTTRELVKAGAHAALGFLDEIDDELAELFFQAFYWEWCHPNPKILSIPDAFREAWKKMRGDNLHGTSIVIWMGRSVFKSVNASGENVLPKSVAKNKKVKK